jgi:hypothetical protein
MMLPGAARYPWHVRCTSACSWGFLYRKFLYDVLSMQAIAGWSCLLAGSSSMREGLTFAAYTRQRVLLLDQLSCVSKVLLLYLSPIHLAVHARLVG